LFFSKSLIFRLHQVKALQDGERMREYLALLRTMEGYASLVFPHCASDAKRDGHVVPILSFHSFRLQVSYLGYLTSFMRHVESRILVCSCPELIIMDPDPQNEN